MNFSTHILSPKKRKKVWCLLTHSNHSNSSNELFLQYTHLLHLEILLPGKILLLSFTYISFSLALSGNKNQIARGIYKITIRVRL